MKDSKIFERNPYIKIDSDIFYKSDAENMTRDQLDEIIFRIEGAIKSCKDQMSDVERRCKNKTDPFYVERITSLNHAVSRYRKAELWFSVARKKLKRIESRDECLMFRKVAKEILDPELYGKISLRAKAESLLEKEYKNDIGDIS